MKLPRALGWRTLAEDHEVLSVAARDSSGVVLCESVDVKGDFVRSA